MTNHLKGNDLLRHHAAAVQIRQRLIFVAKATPSGEDFDATIRAAKQMERRVEELTVRP